MKKEVIFNVGVIINDKFVGMIGKLGVALLLECRKDDQDAVVLTLDGGSPVVLKLGDIKNCFVIRGNDLPIVGFVFHKDKVSIDGGSCQALLFYPINCEETLYILGRETCCEFEVSVNFISKHFRGIKPKNMGGIEAINSYLHGFKLLESKVSKDICDARTYFENFVYPNMGVQIVMLNKYKRYFRSYVQFMQKKSWTDRDFKTFMRSSKNLPKLFKERFGCDRPSMLGYIAENFVIDHACGKSNSCKGVGYLKCSECRFTYYCSKQCQYNHWWFTHRYECQGIKAKYLELERSRAVLQSHILKQVSCNNGESPLTFEVFVQEIERALFHAYFSVIENTNYYDDNFNMYFLTKSKSAWMKGLKALQRKRYKPLKISASELESQLKTVFKTKDVFSSKCLFKI